MGFQSFYGTQFVKYVNFSFVSKLQAKRLPLFAQVCYRCGHECKHLIHSFKIKRLLLQWYNTHFKVTQLKSNFELSEHY